MSFLEIIDNYAEAAPDEIYTHHVSAGHTLCLQRPCSNKQKALSYA